MDAAQTHRHVRLSPRLEALLAAGAGAPGVSVRGHDRVLRLARTIADLEGRAEVETRDFDEAVAYRLGAREAVAA
jgi:magnesium chelatase family protein